MPGRLRIEPETKPAPPTTKLSRLVFISKDGRNSVVRQHFEGVLVSEEVLVKDTTREDASICMEQQYMDEIEGRRESEGW